jgi:hypothetical protein
MSQRGRPPKPVEQKRLLGNPGRRPLPDVAEVAVIAGASSVPEPARSLGSDGFVMWHRVWSAGIPWLSPHTDVELLLILCESVDERTALLERVLSSGDNSDRRALRALNSEISSALSLLGFTPTDRTRLGLAEVKRESRLEELQRRRDSR